jgi:hypothetical protein
MGTPSSIGSPEAPVSADCLLLVAIDDNRAAWFQMLVPFLVSLRQTDYGGDVGVLSYGLGEQKREILRRMGILVLEPLRQSGLATDRWVSAAHVLEQHPRYEKAAVVDADIWFSSTRLSLFAQVASDGLIHVAPDYVAADFIFAPVRDGPQADGVRASLHAALSNIGPLQAGLLAGDRRAWHDFAAFLESELADKEQLSASYGIDTTLLMLYAGGGGVKVLSKRHNAVPLWGLRRKHFPRPGFTLDAEEVEGVHMVGELRHYDCWSFQGLHPDIHLREAAAFALDSPSQSRAALDEQPVQVRTNDASLRLLSGRAHGGCHAMDAREAAAIAGAEHSTVLICRGDAELNWEAAGPSSFELTVCTIGAFMHPVNIEVELNGQTYRLVPNLPARVTMGAGVGLVLRTRAPDPAEAVALLVFR